MKMNKIFSSRKGGRKIQWKKISLKRGNKSIKLKIGKGICSQVENIVNYAFKI